MRSRVFFWPALLEAEADLSLGLTIAAEPVRSGLAGLTIAGD